MTQICIVGRDWKFRALVRAELREQGYEALGLETLDEVGKAVAAGELSPAAIVFDLSETDDRDRDLSTLRSLALSLPVILIASHSNLPDSSTVPASVTTLFRPLTVADIVSHVRARMEKP